MSTAALVGLQEYLTTTYRPDCDYVDGVLVERNVGQKDHSELQGEYSPGLTTAARSFVSRAFPEQRIKINARRFRIPDLCVVALPEPDEQIFTQPPYICIEILSPDDTFPSLQERFDDYLAMGVPNVWVLDPSSRRGWRVTREGHFEALDGVLRTSDDRVNMPIADLFA